MIQCSFLLDYSDECDQGIFQNKLQQEIAHCATGHCLSGQVDEVRDVIWTWLVNNNWQYFA
jgi:hypothetical protein